MQLNPQAAIIERLVSHTREKLRRNRLLTGIGLTVALALTWLLLAAAIDMLAPLPVPLRVTAFIMLAAIAAAAVVGLVLRPALRPPTVQDIAFRIERMIPGMHNRLVTVIDLHNRNGAAAVDEAFANRLVQQTNDRLAGYKAEWVARPTPVRRSAGLAVLTVLTLVLMLVLLGERMPAAVKRILLPTASIAPGSWVRIVSASGDVGVLQGEPATIEAKVTRGGVTKLDLLLRAGDGKWQPYPMELTSGGGGKFSISSVDTSYEYMIRGGGTWTRAYKITMIRRPIVESLAAAVRLPDYMAIPERRAVEAEAMQVSAPLGSSIELAAKVGGDPVRGQIRLYKASTTTTEETRETELVWFDDELPGDAVEIGEWKWTADRVYSGARAHTFGWNRKPYGFTTRLNKFSLPIDGSIFVYAYLDPSDKPGRITASFLYNATTLELAWGAPPPAGTPAKPNTRTAEMGPIPVFGNWVRLEAEGPKLLGGALAAPLPLSGVTFSIDKGRAYIDRVGAIQRKKETIQKQTLEPTATIPMAKDEKSGEWRGHIPVQVDGSYSVEFFNQRNDASRVMKPVSILCTVDQPPAVIVEKPGTSLTIEKAEPIPMMVRAFDDYGVLDVGLQVGTDGKTFADPKWVSHFDKPAQNQLVLSSIDPRVMAIAPGASVYYRLAVKDRKDQVAYSDAFRLGLASPGAAAAPDLQRAGEPMKPLLDSISRLLDAQGKINASALATLDQLPATTRPASRIVKLLNPDGTEMTPEQIEKYLKEQFDKLTPEQRKALTDLDSSLTEQRLKAIELAQQLSAASEAAEKSVFSLPAEQAALGEMSKHMRELAAEGGEEKATDAAVLDRMRELAEHTTDQKAELGQLRKRMEELQAARAKVGEDAAGVQQQIADMLAEMQGSRAARAMNDFGSDLQSQRRELEDLRRQIAELEEKAEDAPGRELDKVSEDQKKLDAEALAALKESRDLLSEELANMEEGKDRDLPAPWIPPGQKSEAAPAEADTPDKAKAPDAKKEPAAAANAAEEQAKKDEEKKNWWDKEVDPLKTGRTTEGDERFADRDKRPVEAAPSDAHTPREMLQEHQREMQRHLSDQERALAKQGDKAGGLSQQMRDMLSKMANASPQERAAMAAQMREMMASQGARGAMAAASRARATAMAKAMAGRGQGGKKDPSGQAYTTPPTGAAGATGQGGLYEGDIMSVDLSGIELNGQGAALYRLPPRVRDPLIQGMQEKGPEAYQRLIDAYYRQLSKDVK